MSNRIVSLRLVAAITCAVLGTSISGCSDPGPTASDNAERETGTLTLPLLSTGQSGEQYRLRGSAEITGPETASLNLNQDEATLTLNLQPGAYILTLGDGWRLQRPSGDGSWERVDAELDGPPQLAFNVRAGQVTYVSLTFLVGDAAIAFGKGRVDINVNVIDGPPPYCGDGEVDPGEECDYGSDPWCYYDCTYTMGSYCGNGIIDPGEYCDYGSDPWCNYDCTYGGYCGDGIVNPGEQCDYGSDPGCNYDCTYGGMGSYCGDGIVNAGEACDDGNTVDGDGCSSSCLTPQCGDGIVDLGEQCDDGNMVDNDECSNKCLEPACGDGLIQFSEECDDANLVDDDGCTNSCLLP